jgi:NAD(P)-dependent dehydrogenase (short-subunit alcohol dehydrogenase family)
MSDRLILITGTTSGLGLETAKQLAAKNVHLVLAVRNTSLAEKQAEVMMQETGNKNIEVMPLDLSSFRSIEAFVSSFTDKFDSLDVLVNNAGVFCDTAKKTAEGFEMTMGVNFVGNYYLTKLLLETIKKGDSPRIINVASKAGYYGKIKVKEGFFKTHPHGFKAYSASKLAQIWMTIYLAEELSGDHVAVNAVHPGQVATGIWKGDSFLMKLVAPINKRRYASPMDACATSVYLASSDQVKGITGKLFENEDQVMVYNARILDRDQMKALIAYTEKLIMINHVVD